MSNKCHGCLKLRETHAVLPLCKECVSKLVEPAKTPTNSTSAEIASRLIAHSQDHDDGYVWVRQDVFYDCVKQLRT